jgi:protoheme ferro-lyase
MPLRQFAQRKLHTDVQTEGKFGFSWQPTFILIIWLQPPVSLAITSVSEKHITSSFIVMQ